MPEQDSLRVSDVRSLRAVIARRQAPQLVLAIPGLDADELSSWQQRLNDQLHTCGCSEGLIGLLLGAAAFVAAVVLGWPGIPRDPYALVISGLLVAVLSAGFGRLVGKDRGRRAARRSADDIALTLAARHAS